jgi:hypothetical protein
MCVVDLNRCDCDCHERRMGDMFRVVHIVNCCSSCTYCGKDRITSIWTHEDRCSLNPKNQGDVAELDKAVGC